MCDTFVAPPSSTAERIMIFAKNSDRQRNEAQALERHHAARHAPDSHLDCTYVTIPQVRNTFATLICRPYWLWGAEIGANEHGVAIGNETVYARSPGPEEPALIGMDLVRLGLERSTTADEAVAVMTALLREWGQGGDCGHNSPFYYNNSFMIADPKRAFVLETVGREWLVEEVEGPRAISNCYSIGSRVDQRSGGLDVLIEASGWGEGAPEAYDHVLADPEKDKSARSRLDQSLRYLRARGGAIEVADARALLRTHGPTDPALWSPRDNPPHGLCLHAGGHDRGSQTTGSMVSELRSGHALHWVTGTAAPCISLFRPVFLDVPLPGSDRRPTGTFHAGNLWWRHEQLHRRAVAFGLPEFIAGIADERGAMEREFQDRATSVRDAPVEERARVVAQCWERADEAQRRWLDTLAPASRQPCSPYDAAWTKMSLVCGVPD